MSEDVKRKAIKTRRKKQKQNQQRNLFLVIAGIAVLLVAIIVIPSVIEARTPVGNIVMTTPHARPMEAGTALGDPNAPVLVEVWEDFQCPACRVYSEQTERLFVDNYVATGKVYYVFRQYPFLDDRSATKESDQAASASLCAAEQGRFWDYHDILFANMGAENIGSFSDKRLAAYAETLGLDMNAFNACYKENRYIDKIAEDLADGRQAGVTGTPSVFVNGKIVKPGFIPTYEDLRDAVEAALVSGG